ncbi:unnamed protein product, partial [marine sediment metagenome]
MNGNKEDKEIEKASILSQHRVSAMATVSLREILKTFPMTEKKILDSPYCITKIGANASKGEEIEPYIDNKKYGIKVHRDRKINSFEWNYNIKIKDGYAENPLDKTGIKTILSNLNDAGIDDAPVDYLRVLLHDSEIGKLKDMDENLFHATLISEKCDEKERAIVADHKVNELLIKNDGFQYRVLNCRELISRREELNEDIQNYLIRWKGKTGYSLNSPIKIAQRMAR